MHIVFSVLNLYSAFLTKSRFSVYFVMFFPCTSLVSMKYAKMTLTVISSVCLCLIVFPMFQNTFWQTCFFIEYTVQILLFKFLKLRKFLFCFLFDWCVLNTDHISIFVVMCLPCTTRITMKYV